jgi:hypothetical protein
MKERIVKQKRAIVQWRPPTPRYLDGTPACYKLRRCTNLYGRVAAGLTDRRRRD